MLTYQPRLSVMLLLIGVFLNPQVVAAATPDEHNVLVIYSYHHALPWQKAFREGFISGLKPDIGLNYFEETLDATRFRDPKGIAAFSDFIIHKYRHQPLDLILFENDAASYLVDPLAPHFKGVPRVLANPDEKIAMDSGHFTIFAADDLAASFSAMLELRPSAGAIYAIGETHTRYAAENLAAIRSFEQSHPGMNIIYLVDLPLDELLNQVRKIPPDAAVYYLLYFQDGSGTSYIPRDVARMISANAAAPIFTHYDSIVGTGVVGGLVNNGRLAGESAAVVIREQLNNPAARPIRASSLHHLYDDEALRRYNIPHSALPAGSTIINREKSIWTEYRGYVVASGVAISVLTVITMLLGFAYSLVLNSRRKLKASRKLLRRSQAIAHLGTFQCSFGQEMIELSDEACRILGVVQDEPDKTRISVGDFIALVHPADRHLLEDAINQCFSEGTPIDINYSIVQPGGEILVVHQRGTCERDRTGSTTIQSTLYDVTEVRSLQVQLAASHRLESVGRFAGGMAHHFNNLFTIILGNAEMLAANNRDKTNASYINNVMESLQAAADMNASLMSFSKNQSLNLTSVDLRQHVAEMEFGLKTILGHMLSINIEVDDNLWEIPLDFNELMNALTNIAANAAEAMGAEGELQVVISNVTLDDTFVRSHVGASAGEFVNITVFDTGPGMIDDISQRAFDPFFTTKDVGEGSGLGLSMVYGFVKQLNGYIEIQSEATGDLAVNQTGTGTTINLYFPRYAEGVNKTTTNGRQPERTLAF